MEQTHYICTGSCHGQSDKPGTCQATTCEKHNQPLTPCSCADDREHSAKTEESKPKQRP